MKHFLRAPGRVIRGRVGLANELCLLEQAGLVDEAWYRQAYPDVARSGIPPIEHYVRYGFREGRDPRRSFSTRDYLRLHPELVESAGSMAVHYLAHRSPEHAARPTATPPPAELHPRTAAGDEPRLAYEHAGRCPICQKSVRFTSTEPWYRDHLYCDGCEGISTPRERALMHVIRSFFPDWMSLAIHESSPIGRGASEVLRRHCRSYTATQFFPNTPLGTTHQGFRCENLERLTFADRTFDLTISQDVMEHVNRPDLAFREIARTLRPGGAYVFTAPTYKGLVRSSRRAFVHPDSIEHLHPPEYHANPVDSMGSLVTFHYGHDLPERIHQWSGLDTTVLRFHDHHIGVIGDFTEVYLSRKARP